MQFDSVKQQAKKEIAAAKSLKELDEVFKNYLGKKGKITQFLHGLSNLPPEKRKQRGKELNELKTVLTEEFTQKEQEFKEGAIREAEQKEWIDISQPGRRVLRGHLHPLTQTKRKLEEIFNGMGFSIVEGPEVETEYYNFDALNIPKEHPARDMWDTFWLVGEEEINGLRDKEIERPGERGQERLLLRTHTSPVQVRYMEKHNPPLRIIVPGRIFRYEATDASHEFNFYHVEGLMVDEDISAANFKAIMEKFFQNFFARSIGIRLRPSYFPFTEPSFEIDATCPFCGGKGCSVCAQTGWVEMAGAGMVHPNVFKASGYNPKNWQGFAFGMGLDRLAMLRYKINDIRLFYSNDLRFLKQF